MIGISKLYCHTVEPSDPLRYERLSAKLPAELLQFSQDKKPVVVWNITARCNLICRHCYAQAAASETKELTTQEGLTLIDDLAAFGSPVLLLSGGEPLLREDIFELAEHARGRGLRVVISSNGTLLTAEKARRFAQLGVSYIGISIDGSKDTHDRFRHADGAYEKAMNGLRCGQEAGLKVGLRFTINRYNVQDIPYIFALSEEHAIPRICFYHLVYTGRAAGRMADDLNHGESRQAVDQIIDLTAAAHEKKKPLEVLTVDNHADGVYLYLRMRREGNPHADDVLRLLRMNGGNSSGIGIGCVSWDGSVYADQFWRHYSFGNVRQRPFSTIWSDTGEPLMAKLKNRKACLEGRCGSCVFVDACNGNLRLRAEAVTGNLWAPDPACYLSDEEIQIS